MIPSQITDNMRKRLAHAFATHQICRTQSIPFSATALLAWEFITSFKRTVVLITDSLKTQDEMYRNVAAFAGGRESSILCYPPWASLPRQGVIPQAEITGDRLNTLNQLSRHRKKSDPKEPFIVITCAQALMQMTLAPETLRNHTFRIALQDKKDPEAIIKRLEQTGYEFVPQVQCQGQAAQRGGLLDVWPASEQYPLRIEFFGSTVETIRSFDPADQRSFSQKTEATITPTNEWGLMLSNEQARSMFMAHVPKDTIYFWYETCLDDHEPNSIKEHITTYEEIESRAHDRRLTIPFRTVLETIAGNRQANQCFTGWSLATLDGDQNRQAQLRQGYDGQAAAGDSPEQTEWAGIDLGFRSIVVLSAARRGVLEPDILEKQRSLLLASLEKRAKNGTCVHLFFNTQGALDRFRETHPDSLFQLHTGMLSDGFTHESMRMAVIAEAHLMGHQKLLRGRYDLQVRQRPMHHRAAAEIITEWTGIEPGDLVVHVNHGIGRYLGLYEIKSNGKLQESLAVEYADNAKLYVPVSQTHLLSRYIGVGKRTANIHRLGGRRWFREKAAAELAVRDLASSLLEIQAIRESKKGVAFPSDISWQHEFEAAFPYEETDDQKQAIEEVKRNMESSRPMDRVVCGDVGYGKTEVAMRAAFKAVTSGKQVAVLVPTTVLAQQHFDVFIERMSAYPIRVELLCRFRTPRRQLEVVRGLVSGVVDIVIGTHRLLQPDVQFKDLGLVIIDEEQRFGVAHKERLKQVRHLVDVLTLTATPIPRTLYMSLTGTKDISMIQTTPKARLPIETIVAKNEDRLVRDAVLRELNRGGQVYYLHNRVTTIENVRKRLQKLVPEARIAVGHGQMPTTELARVMRQFGRGQIDLLLCTTIIESGVDIPNVNTILIDRADRFGMADLYQLRGRVGRSTRKAYAYLLLPLHGHLLDTSRKRIHAIIQHADLGAGFRLAIRDLEIRGAGNMLGAKQSGHIAAIGFDLYCQLLRRTVAQLSDHCPAHGRKLESLNKLGMQSRIVDADVNLDFMDLSANAADTESSACLPVSYVDDEQLRIHVFRKIASASSLDDIHALRDEFHDRFGPIPAQLNRLLFIAAIRVIAAEKNVKSIESKDGKIMFKKGGDYLQIKHRFPRLRTENPDDRLNEIIHWLKQVGTHGFSTGNLLRGK